MQDDLTKLLCAHKCISVVGMSKNAGKTTALNAMMRCSGGLTVGLSSIGRDGESIDVSTGTAKPGIPVPAGTLFATAEQLIPLCTVTRTVLSMTDVSTPLGRIAILRADSPGCVQLCGPSTVEQTRAISDDLCAFGANRVLIDGAIFRRSIASPLLCDGVVLAVGAAYHHDMEKTVADAAYLCTLLTLPICGGDAELFTGALTDAAAQAMLRQPPRTICLSDPSRALIGKSAYDALLRAGFRLCVADRPALLCVFMNPFSPYGAGCDRAAFRAALQRLLPVPVLDAKEACHD